MFKTIRIQLLFVLLLFAGLGIITSIIVFNYFFREKESISKISNKIEATHVLLLEDMNLIQEFFESETINPIFFETGQSKLLRLHNIKCREIEISIATLNAIQQKSGYEMNKEISKLRTVFVNYKKLTNEIVRQILLRGFKDYGIEGDMRAYAHHLESFKDEIGFINILQLRRHEKDYIIRQESQYLDKHNALVSQIKANLFANKKIGNLKKERILKLLSSYSDLFTRLALYERTIGLKNGLGIKKEINSAGSNIKIAFNSIVNIAGLKEIEALKNLKMILVLIWSLLIVFALIAALLISGKVSFAIINLKEKISEFVKSDFSKRTILPIKNSKNEIDILSLNFSVMEEQIVNQLSELKQTNKEMEMLFHKASHDIKGPLASVKVITRQAIDNVSDPLALKYFSMIDKSRQNLYYIVDELGMITDIKNEAAQIDSINLEKIVTMAFHELDYMTDFKNILFSMQIKMKETFYSDPKLVKIILRNLMENSIKYSNKNNQNPFIKIAINAEKSNIVRITIADNGIGIKKDLHEKIFEMFFRGAKESHGTGLGLYVVNNSLQKLNGAISLESEVGVGTTFTVLLPNKIGLENKFDRIIQKREVFENEENLVFNYI